MNAKHTNPIVGIDLGGTKILTAVVNAQGVILARSKLRTTTRGGGEGPDVVVERIVQTVHEAVARAGLSLNDISAVGASAPGPVNVQTGTVFRAVNLPGWDQPYPLGPSLASHLGKPVVVDNDVNVGTLGEAAYGAARGLKDVIGIFVGTGIGGGVILDGKLRRGFRWAAGEIGHMYMHVDDKLDDVEGFASRGSISRRLEEGVRQGQGKELQKIMRASGKDRITSGVIRRALRAGDPLTSRVVADAQHVLGLLIASVVNLLDPECIVMGGGLVESLGEDYLAEVRETAYSHFFLQRDAHKISILPAALGDDSGVMGAAELARTLITAG